MHEISSRPVTKRRFVNVGANGSLVDLTYRQGAIRITGFGRLYNDTPVDWSFRPYQHEGDEARALRSAVLLPTVAHSLGVAEILAPRPVFGRVVCTSDDLQVRIPFTSGGATVILRRGLDADVCILRRGETFGITAAGCPLGWLMNLAAPTAVVVAHMGLECLVDVKAIQEGRPSSRGSVVDIMWRALKLTDHDAKDVHAGFAFPIDPQIYEHPWDHAEWGTKNRALCEYLVTYFGEGCILNWNDPLLRQQGCIDLGYLIRAQYRAYGIPSPNKHGVGAPDATDGGVPLWYTTRGPSGKSVRNLITFTFNPE